MIQSIQRAFEILWCFEKKEELGITEISKMTGLNKSTTNNIIQALVHCGALRKSHDSKYLLSADLVRLASFVNQDLVKVSSPILYALVNKHEETANAVIFDGDFVRYISKIEPPQSMHIATRVGMVMPLYCTAVGKAILAFLDREDQKNLIEKMDFAPRTPKTITKRDLLEQELKTIYARGYALDDEELENGLICIAVPVFDKEAKPFAAISLSGPSRRMDKERIIKMALDLQEAAKKIEGCIFK